MSRGVAIKAGKCVNLIILTGDFQEFKGLQLFIRGHEVINTFLNLLNLYYGGLLSAQKILIVDDDISVSTVVKITLENRYDVATTTCPVSAFKYLAEHKVDLILLDIKMPKINGLEALKEIKKIYPDIFVIMLTAYASWDNIQKAKAWGAYGLISKPFDIDELRSYVDKVLSHTN